MSATYQEPPLSVLVLDFLKEAETELCLQSIKKHVKVPHRVIYLHNGPSDYAYRFYLQGLVDHFIQTDVNRGLGVGTRDLVAACFSPYFLMMQNDQVLSRDLTEIEFNDIVFMLGSSLRGSIQSVSLAGSPCGDGVYSERAHIMETDFYKSLEDNGVLGYHGAGPYHDGEWREAQFQRYYKDRSFIHYEWPKKPSLVIDNGRRAIRQNPDGSIWEHQPDMKRLWLKTGPVKERHVYPKFTDAEWDEVIKTQSWPDGKIPEVEVKDSFHVWN